MSEEISTHTLTWSVTIDPDITSKDKSISTHTLTWSVTMNTLIIICNYEFQLTRSRGAWQNEHIYLKDVIQISTHTLTWSVTSGGGFGLWIPKYFNSHAHVERDQFTTSFPHKKLNFNSHAHVERDIWGGIKVKSYEISTHTLTWSVTLEGEPATMQNVNFNSHAHVERDHYQRQLLSDNGYFNSHAHVERDVCGG